VSELGRQPWIVYGCSERRAGSPPHPARVTFTAFTLLYVGLTVLTLWAVRRIAARPIDGLPAPAMAVA